MEPDPSRAPLPLAVIASRARHLATDAASPLPKNAVHNSTISSSLNFLSQKALSASSGGRWARGLRQALHRPSVAPFPMPLACLRETLRGRRQTGQVTSSYRAFGFAATATRYL